MTTENTNPPQTPANIETPAPKPEEKKEPVEPKATKNAFECAVEDIAMIKKHLNLDIKKGEEPPKPPPASVPDARPVDKQESLIEQYISGLTDWMF